jgi:hypothetical protein
MHEVYLYASLGDRLSRLLRLMSTKSQGILGVGFKTRLIKAFIPLASEQGSSLKRQLV